jgi:hypothetical protein
MSFGVIRVECFTIGSNEAQKHFLREAIRRRVKTFLRHLLEQLPNIKIPTKIIQSVSIIFNEKHFSSGCAPLFVSPCGAICDLNDPRESAGSTFHLTDTRGKLLIFTIAFSFLGAFYFFALLDSRFHFKAFRGDCRDF